MSTIYETFFRNTSFSNVRKYGKNKHRDLPVQGDMLTALDLSPEHLNPKIILQLFFAQNGPMGSTCVNMVATCYLA